MPLKHYIGSYLVSLLLANFIVLEKGIELWKTNQTLDSMIPFFFFKKRTFGFNICKLCISSKINASLRGILLKYNLLFILLKTKSSSYSLPYKIMGLVNKLID